MPVAFNVRPQRLAVRYSSIDPVLFAWAARHELKLPIHDERGAELDFRNAYTSSSDAECCQIWIDPPEGGTVNLHMASVESRDDQETRQDWCVPVCDLEDALETALKSARSWMGRQT